jgi:unsaturated chondroitin disaccharide hydrolase
MESEVCADAIERMLERIDASAAALAEAFPLAADPATGAWQTSPDGRWTGGFWAGQLWLAARASGQSRHADLARAAMRRLESRLGIDNVLNGLVFHYGAVSGASLHDDTAARALALQGAQALASHFNDKVGYIPLGHQSGSLTADPAGETNIDGVPGMSLLFWAAAESGDAGLRRKASRHVERHIELCQRPDGSLHQAALVDPKSGATLRQYSPRGHSDAGAWARAQSWGLLGFVQAHAWTKEPAFLRAAERVADWWIEHVPANRVAFWDFGDPAIPNTERDTSGTAMTASALLKLGRLSPRGERYAQAGRETVEALVRDYLTPTSGGDRRPRGILTEGCWQHNEGMATRHELVWGDYFMLEALLCMDGRLEDGL